MKRNLVLALLAIALGCSVCFAADLTEIMDKFYADLAKIIEANMDDALGCVQAVKAYYAENQDMVAKIREETAKAMSQAASMTNQMMDEYTSVQNKEEAEAIGQKYAGMQGTQKPQMSAAMQRYTQALQTFTMKYPQQGMEVAMQAMQFMPAQDMQR